MYKEIIDKIIAILKAYTGLIEPTDIRKYFVGEPLKIYDYPTIYVELEQDALDKETTDKTRHLMDFGIVVVNRNADPEKADKDALDLAEKVRAALEANATLDALVLDSDIVGVRFIAGNVENFALSGVRSVLRCLKYD